MTFSDNSFSFISEKHPFIFLENHYLFPIIFHFIRGDQISYIRSYFCVSGYIWKNYFRVYLPSLLINFACLRPHNSKTFSLQQIHLSCERCGEEEVGYWKTGSRRKMIRDPGMIDVEGFCGGTYGLYYSEQRANGEVVSFSEMWRGRSLRRSNEGNTSLWV